MGVNVSNFIFSNDVGVSNNGVSDSINGVGVAIGETLYLLLACS